MIENIKWLGHAGFKLKGEKTIYIDPFKINETEPADIIIVTHEHFDHLSPEDIKKAHRNLARRWHPDVNKSSEAVIRFIEMQTAYDVLNNPQKRATYDQSKVNLRRHSSDHFCTERTSASGNKTEEDLEECLRNSHRKKPRQTDDRFASERRTKTIEDFVDEVGSNILWDNLDAARSTYTRAEQFARSNIINSYSHNPFLSELRTMRRYIINAYTRNVQKYISINHQMRARSAYRTAEEFAKGTTDPIILGKLFDMKLAIIDGYSSQIKANIAMPFMESYRLEKYREAERIAGSSPDQVILNKLKAMKLDVLDGYLEDIKIDALKIHYIDSAVQRYKKAEQFVESQKDLEILDRLKRMRLVVLDGYLSDIQISLEIRYFPGVQSSYSNARDFVGSDQDSDVLMRLDSMRRAAGFQK